MLLGAERVVAIDRYPECMVMTERFIGCETLDYTKRTSRVNCGR